MAVQNEKEQREDGRKPLRSLTKFAVRKAARHQIISPKKSSPNGIRKPALTPKDVTKK